MIRNVLFVSSFLLGMGMSAQVPADNKAAYFNGSSYIKVDQPIQDKFTFSAWVNQDMVDKGQAKESTLSFHQYLSTHQLTNSSTYKHIIV